MQNLVIRTPYSEIKNQTSLQYPSTEALKKHPGDMVTNLEFDKSRIAVRDILIFVPSLEGPLKGNKQATFNDKWKTDWFTKRPADSLSGNWRGRKYQPGCLRTDQRIAGCKKSIL